MNVTTDFGISSRPINKPPREVNKKEQKIHPISSVKSYTIHALTFGISSIFERCLSCLLGLEVMQHGTCITNYLSIVGFGTDPSKGGTGACEGIQPYAGEEIYTRYKTDSLGQFHVVSDERVHNHELREISHWLVAPATTFVAKTYAGWSTVSKLKNLPYIREFFGALAFLFSPILRFHYTTEDADRVFEEDPQMVGAIRTATPITPDRIGIRGVLNYGSLRGIGQRFYDRPIMMTACVVGLVAGAALTAVGLGFVT